MVTSTLGLWDRTWRRVRERVERALDSHDLVELPPQLLMPESDAVWVASCTKVEPNIYSIDWNVDKLLDWKYVLEFKIEDMILAMEEVWAHEYSHILTDAWYLSMDHCEYWQRVAKEFGALPLKGTKLSERIDFRRRWYETHGYEIPSATTVVGSICA